MPHSIFESILCGENQLKIKHFSDGASSQYKNQKNIHNLCLHESDFGIPAEWHFLATSHGKGACDGIGTCQPADTLQQPDYDTSSTV